MKRRDVDQMTDMMADKMGMGLPEYQVLQGEVISLMQSEIVYGCIEHVKNKCLDASATEILVTLDSIRPYVSSDTYGRVKELIEYGGVEFFLMGLMYALRNIKSAVECQIRIEPYMQSFKQLTEELYEDDDTYGLFSVDKCVGARITVIR